jgi:Fe-S-cluster containining protein
MSHLLDNYQQLINRVDVHCAGIAAYLGSKITCSAGCSTCCTAITIFPIEAAALREALQSRSAQQAEKIRRHVSENAGGERCPLLHNHHCLLYEARPIICRTHGLPLIYTTDGQRHSDCCPLNLTDVESISGAHTIDLDTLNTLLVAVNATYQSQSEASETLLRVTIADALTVL